jgi:uncharacterized protein YqgC (DUF456 family)
VAGFWIALVVMLVGVAGTIFPAVPGLPLIWLAALGYGLATGFKEIGWLYLTLSGLVVLLVQVAEQMARAWGAKRYGASKLGTWGAILGSLIGLFFFPLGLFLGPFLGALVAEWIGGRSFAEAARAGWGGLVGMLSSVLLNFVVAVGLTVSFAVAVLR